MDAIKKRPRGRRLGEVQVSQIALEELGTATYRQRFGRRLRILRLERGWSLASLGRRITRRLHAGWHDETVGAVAIVHWEKGRSAPKFHLLPFVAAALRISVAELMPPE